MKKFCERPDWAEPSGAGWLKLPCQGAAQQRQVEKNSNEAVDAYDLPPTVKGSREPPALREGFKRPTERERDEDPRHDAREKRNWRGSGEQIDRNHQQR